MPRFKKVFKKYERGILLGLVILLLATFSITGAARCEGPGGGQSLEMGGTFKVSPSERTEIDDDEFDRMIREYDLFRAAMPVPSAEFPAYTFGMGPQERIPAGWMHQLLLSAAEHAGYEAGERQVTSAIEDLVGFVLMVNARLPFNDVNYQQYLHDNYRSSPATFRQRMREVVLKDQFVYPLVTSARYTVTYPEAYEAWKASRERVDLRYVALPAAPFADLVRNDEETRRTIATQLDLARDTGSVAGTVHRVHERVEQVHKETGAWPKSLDDLQGFKVIPDAWGTPLRYQVDGDAIDLRSAGPDKLFDTDDDITVETQRLLDTHGALHTVAEKLVQRHKSAGAWPKALAELLEADASGRLPGLANLVKDGWGHELAYALPEDEGAVPTLSSLGADGEPGGGDDLVLVLAGDAVHVSPLGALAARLTPTVMDAWGHAFHLSVKAAQPTVAWNLVSDGADGKTGTDDDLSTGNAGEIRTFFGPIRSSFVEPARREFETLFVHLPLVTDAALAKLWEKYADQRPTDEEELYRYWRSYKGDQFFYRAENPGDPDTGHGADIVKQVAPEAVAVLVPSKDIFPAQLSKPDAPPKKDDEAKDDEAKDDEAKDETKKDDEAKTDDGAEDDGAEDDARTYREKGWREIVIRERFLENVLNHLLQRVRESAQAVKEAKAKVAAWEGERAARDAEIEAWDEKYAADPTKAPAPRPEAVSTEAPAVPEALTFTSLLQGELSDLIASGDDKTPPAIQYWKTPQAMTREEYEANENFGSGLQFELNRLKEDGEYNGIPAQLHRRITKVLVRRTGFTPQRQQEFEDVADKVFARFVEKRQMDRAVAELGKLQTAVGEAEGKLAEGADDAARAQAFDDAFAAWSQGVPAEAIVETTGMFIGSNPPPARETDDTTAAADKARIERRNFVWRGGYEAVRPTGQDAEGKGVALGAFGNRVLPDPVIEGETADEARGTGHAYLVRVAAQAFPTKEEFSPRRYLEHISTKVLGERQRSRSADAARGSFLAALDHYYNDTNWMQTTFDLLTEKSLGVFSEKGRKGGGR